MMLTVGSAPAADAVAAAGVMLMLLCRVSDRKLAVPATDSAGVIETLPRRTEGSVPTALEVAGDGETFSPPPDICTVGSVPTAEASARVGDTLIEPNPTWGSTESAPAVDAAGVSEILPCLVSDRKLSDPAVPAAGAGF